MIDRAAGLSFVPFAGARQIVSPAPSTFAISRAVGWWRPWALWIVHVGLAAVALIWIPLLGPDWTWWLVAGLLPLLALPQWFASMAWTAAALQRPALAHPVLPRPRSNSADGP